MELKRWFIMNRVYIFLFFLIGIISYIDSKQIITFFTLNTEEAWRLYHTYTMPSFIVLWLLIITSVSIVYHLFSKDKSETLGIFLSGTILLFTGLEDVFYFIFSKQSMTQCMQWFNDINAPVAWFSTNILKETCTSPKALILFSIIGIITSYIVFNRLKRAKW